MKVKVTEIYKSSSKSEDYFCSFFRNLSSAFAYIDSLSETFDLDSSVEFLISFEKDE